MAVIGGGNSAAEESLLLTKYADKVTLLVRGDKFNASKVVEESVLGDPKIEVRFDTEVRAFQGAKSKLNALQVHDRRTEQDYELPIDGTFVFIGLDPEHGHPARLRHPA